MYNLVVNSHSSFYYSKALRICSAIIATPASLYIPERSQWLGWIDSEVGEAPNQAAIVEIRASKSTVG